MSNPFRYRWVVRTYDLGDLHPVNKRRFRTKTFAKLWAFRVDTSNGALLAYVTRVGSKGLRESLPS